MPAISTKVTPEQRNVNMLRAKYEKISERKQQQSEFKENHDEKSNFESKGNSSKTAQVEIKKSKLVFNFTDQSPVSNDASTQTVDLTDLTKDINMDTFPPFHFRYNEPQEKDREDNIADILPIAASDSSHKQEDKASKADHVEKILVENQEQKSRERELRDEGK